MNKTETAQLLTIASGFDRRQVDAMTVEAWHAIIGDYTFTEAQKALLDHYRDAETRHKYMGVADILDRLELFKRRRKSDALADNRSARARGIIDDDYPWNQPLTDDLAAQLAEARERDRQEAIANGASEITAGT